MKKERFTQKGFTLIELLVTIALMLSILGIAIVSFINVSDRKKEESWETVKGEVETAAMEYFNANEYLYEGLADNATGYITVGKLVEENYINRVVNPKTGKMIDYCTQVTVTKNGKSLAAKYTDQVNNKNCDFNSSVTLKEDGAPDFDLNRKCPKTSLNKDEKGDLWCNKTDTVEIISKQSNVSYEKVTNTCNSIMDKSIDCSDGIHNLGIKATNTSGKSTIKYILVNVDTIKPSIDLAVSGTKGKDTTGKETGWYVSKVSMNSLGTCNNISGCYVYNQDNNKIATLDYKKDFNLEAYKNISDTKSVTKKVTIKSGAGLSSDSSKTVKIDTIKPTVSIVVASTKSNYNTATANVTLKVSDGGSGINVVSTNVKNSSGISSWDKNGSSSWNTTYGSVISGSLNGTSITPNVSVTDIAGNSNNAIASKYTVYKDCSNVTTSTTYDHSCGNYGYRNKSVVKKDTKTGNSCGAATKTKEDCSVKAITMDLNNNDANASSNAGMGGVGPNGTSSGKPIFNRPSGTAPNTYNYSKTAKRGMDVTVGNLSGGDIAYAGASCMNVGDFARRFKYQITWTDGSKSDVRYATYLSDGFTQDYKIYNDRNTPITLKLTDTSKALTQCKNIDGINVNKCIKDANLSASRDNVSTHSLRLSIGGVSSNKLILYTKYFANCGY